MMKCPHCNHRIGRHSVRDGRSVYCSLDCWLAARGEPVTSTKKTCRETKQEYNRRYAQEHKEEIRAYQRQWYHLRKTEQAAQEREWIRMLFGG